MKNKFTNKIEKINILTSNFYFVCFYSLITRKNYEENENDY